METFLASSLCHAGRSRCKRSGTWRTSIQLSALVTLLAGAALAQLNVTTYHNDNSRTGLNANETILNLNNVNKNSFGKLFQVKLDGYVYAQPLYVSNVNIPAAGTHNVVYVATEHDSVYALDADNATTLWHATFLGQGISSVSSGNSGIQCLDLSPEVGITGTPVIDLTSGTLYVLAKTKEHGQYKHRLHALDITTGQDKAEVEIVASVTDSNQNTVAFDPLRQAQRPGLLLQNGQVFIGWASHCDNGPYNGWVMAYDAGTLNQVAVWNSSPDGYDGGVWQSGGGLAGDAQFNTYFATGNGDFNVDQGGVDYGDSILKLEPPAHGVFKVKDYFTPFDQASLNGGDVDLGSGGVLLLPDQPRRSPHTQLLAQSGKEGTLYLIDRNKMKGYNPLDDSNIVQSIPLSNGGLWGSPAWWNNHLYIGGEFDNLKAFAFDPKHGLFGTSPDSQSATVFNYPGPTPSVSSNGNSNAIVWAIQTENYGTRGQEILHAYDATNLGTELYNSTMVRGRDAAGVAVKFAVPTVANGKVYVGAGRSFSIFGLR